MLDMPRAADIGVCMSSAASYASRLTKNFNMSPIKICFALIREEATECATNVPNTELRLAFVESGHLLMGIYSNDMRCSFRRRAHYRGVKYERIVQRVFNRPGLGLLAIRERVFAGSWL